MEKRIFLFILLVTAFLLTAPAAAGADYYVAGDFNGWNAAGNAMDDQGDGTWQVSLSGVSGRHEFKITDGTWGSSYPGPNSWFYGPASGNVDITFNLNTVSDGWYPASNRIGVSPDPGYWTAVGSWQSWDNDDPTTAMVSQGGGIYYYEQLLAPGNYLWKAVVTGTWDSISWDNRSVNAANWAFTTDPSYPLVKFWVDPIHGAAKVEVAEASTPVPEPSTMLLLGSGLIGLLGFRRKLRK